ncbi:dual-domain excinuclease ABC subunit A uvrA [Candidatus Kinetoplastibacterium oncopeltii TCC290E]|uniref:UvrABC system protein A n=1 Tax=Candidatus Kinetoplastidibacterium stringomonadis TCC290E TaxID=1208920 RepID=M1LZJ7_9PROT|nr:excinuclease ABC subunit UvrA [Candidatus Kinetoplastibacterium oncopeltii]AGF48534.1 dual-domain excinuclease ABC subunit A uvrA [Candidatus Kinetoplastibacterium oncopeltii TCC290E]
MKSNIKITGAKQNNLKNLSLNIGAEDFIIVTGVSGSGKSSLVFDTIYAEGQRRYIETFSTYARQFLDQMDKPDVTSISGILPAIAIYQKNHIKNSRSTVGSLTEINEYLKILFANNSNLFCENCNQLVRKHTPDSILKDLNEKIKVNKNNKLKITFPIILLPNIREDILESLSKKGYLDIYKENFLNNNKTDIQTIFVIQDRINLSKENQNRCYEAIETAMFMGNGEVVIYYCCDHESNEITLRYNSNLKCNNCNLVYDDISTSNFSFNSPLGACDKCSGFGDILEIDIDRIIPDDSKTLMEGAIKPWQSNTFKLCQHDLENYANIASIPLKTPWKDLSKNQQDWVIYGDCEYSSDKWYGIKRFFSNIEKKSYKMYIRVLLSKYRKYLICPKCNGRKFNNKSLLWRIGSTEDQLKNNHHTIKSIDQKNTDTVNISDVLLMSVNDALELFNKFKKNRVFIKSDNQTVQEIEIRLDFLKNIGLDYLTLDRKGKTLSGGEAQRINLTTALGSSLINTMFVLDEPSNGLHYKDISKVLESIKKLNDYGNCLIVIEHNLQLILSADRVIELGPGSGINGGNIIFDGSPCELYKADTITSKYANNKLKFEKQYNAEPINFNDNVLLIAKAHANNLKDISIKIPLNKLVCITGVSGSGKTTLLREIIYNGLHNKKHSELELLNRKLFEKIDGYDGDVTLIDNSPIIRSTRSNIASYINIFKIIRVLFSKAPLSIKRKYSSNTFSFNSGHGRCPTCNGSGLEFVEMHFLPDIYLCCKDCEGKRFRKEILEVFIELNNKRASIDQILDMTVNESIVFFSTIPEIINKLSLLVDIGLDYLKLGQTLAEMSNGELRRIKLICNVINILHNNSRKQNSHMLLIDEPTLGLHVNEIYNLIEFLHKLIDTGHSIILIEHNLEVIRTSDWVIDLGPEGGDKGGYVVAEDYPESLMRNNLSYTGKALSYSTNKINTCKKHYSQKVKDNLINERYIEIYNAEENNLQNIDIKIPLNQFTVITGVSGSGKSTLAFDILFNEGQRRYLLTLNSYAKSIIQSSKRAKVGKIINLPPTIAIKQHKELGNYKSTVSNISEIHNFLRIIYAKLGEQHCPICNTIIKTHTVDQIIAKILRDYHNLNIIIFSPINIKNNNFRNYIEKEDYKFLFVKNKSITQEELLLMSSIDNIVIDKLIGNILIQNNQEEKLRKLVNYAIDTSNGFIKILLIDDTKTHIIDGKYISKILSQKLISEKLYNIKPSCVNCNIVLPKLEPLLFSHNSKIGHCLVCKGTGIHNTVKNKKNQYSSEDILSCNKCNGKRLNEEALSVYWHGYNIAEILSMSVNDVINFFRKIKIKDRENLIAKNILKEICSKLYFMKEVGLGYLELDRPEPTLSGGESQRVHLAAQLGSDTQGACYVLDEPTIGLHPVDNKKLINSLLSLKNKGNTIVVVEHDSDMIKESSHIIDMGPGAGLKGGKIVAQGSLSEVLASKDSVTARFLKKERTGNYYKKRIINSKTKFIQIKNANLHNINSVNAQFPLSCLNVVTGVSGSGKSTLIQEILFKNIHRVLKDINNKHYTNCECIEGICNINNIVSIDQNPIGKTPRSCPATYIGFWDEIRKKFANTTAAKIKGWDHSRFSFNSKEGRCKECNGLGTKIIEMNFMPDVKIICECCNGLRFNKETLMIEFLDKNIGETLMMEVDQAMAHFINFPLIYRPLKFLHDIGLGYLSIGQSSSTLSGGESQRIKIVSELIKNDILISKDRKNIQQHTIYVMDEPTTGLSMSDVDHLVTMLQKLINSGNSIIAIEHNLEFIANADWIVDIGPNGGSCGGNVVFQGTFKSLSEKSSELTLTQEAVQNFLK